MSATVVSFIAHEYNAYLESARWRNKWWARLAERCSASECPYRGKLWPAWLRKPGGVLFEGRWYCEPECLKPALESRLLHLLSNLVVQKTRTHRVPLGLLLVGHGSISPEQLREALHLQRDIGGGRLGDLFRQMGAVSEQQLAAALGQQWGCPVFPIEQQALQPAWTRLVPLPLLESAHTAVVHASPDGHVLHLCFGERLDHPLLFAVEHMLGCRAVACVAPETKVADFLALWRRHAEKTDASFDTVRDPREMAWVICNYATELEAPRVAVVRTSAHIWVRFYNKKVARDLLFRISPESTPASSHERFSAAAKAFSLAADSRKGGVADATGPL
jgi:hypothetical protein